MATIKKKSALDEAKALFSKINVPQPTQGQNKIVSGVGRAVKSFGTDLYKRSGITDYVGGAYQNITNTIPGIYNTVAGNKQLGRQQLATAQQGANRVFGSGINPQGKFEFTGTGAPRVALTAASGLAGKAALAGGAAFGGVIGGGMAAAQRQDVPTAIGQGASQGVRFAGVNKVISPVANPITERIGGALGQIGGLAARASKGDIATYGKLGAVVGRTIGKGGANVAEGQLYNQAYNNRKSSPGEILQDFIIGGGIEGFSASKSLQIDKQGFLRNKAGQLFDPSTGQFAKASQKIRSAQVKAVSRLMEVGPTPDNPLGGMKLGDLAQSRLTQGGFLRLGGKSTEVPSIPDTLGLSTGQKLSEQPGSLNNPLAEGATNSTNGSHSKTNPAALGSIVSPQVQNYLQELTGKQKTAASSGTPGIRDKGKSFLATLKSSIVDSTSPIEDALSAAEKQGKFKVLPRNDVRLQIDRVLRSPTLASQFAKDNGMVDVIRQAPDLDALNQYLIAKQASKVAENGVTTGRNAVKDQQLIQELGSVYEPLARQVNQYSQKLLDYSVSSGLIDESLATQLKQQYPDYVPLQRIFNELETTGRTGVSNRPIASLSKQSVVQKLKGSEREIANPIESLLLKTGDAFNQGERNIAAKQLASYKDLPGFEGLLTELKGDAKAPHTISFLDKGVKRTFATTPELEAAAKSLDKEQLNTVVKIMSYPTRLLQLGATGLNASFTLTNLFKDQMTSFVNSDTSVRSSLLNPINFGKALFAAVKHDDLYDEVVRNAAGGTSYDISRQQPELSVAKIRSDKNLKSKIAYTVRNPGELLRAIENVIGRSEELGRIQNYRGTKTALLGEGRTAEDAALLGAKAARENTANFARKGNIGQVINYMIPFFNAGIQGSRQLVRSFQNKPKATSAKVALTVFTPLAAATSWNLSDPTRKKIYEDIQEHEKENNIIIIPNGATQDAKGKWNVIKIPLPPGLSNLGTLVRRPMEQAEGLDPVRFGEIANNLLSATTSLNTDPSKLASTLTPQFAKPIVEAASNTNLFTGAQIVPTYMANLPKEDQVRDNTSGTTRLIGKATNTSPLMVQNAISTMTGGVGQQLLNASDTLLNKAGKIPEEQIGGESVGANLKRRFRQASGNKSLEAGYDNSLSQDQMEKYKTLVKSDKGKGEKYLNEVLDNRKLNKAIKEGTPITIENPTPGQKQQIKNEAIDRSLGGNLEEAKQLRDKYQLKITPRDINERRKEMIDKSIDLSLDGDLAGAKELRDKNKLTIRPADIRAGAKRKARELYKAGYIEDSKALQKKYGFILSTKDFE